MIRLRFWLMLLIFFTRHLVIDLDKLALELGRRGNDQTYIAFAAAFASLCLVTQYGGFYVASLLCLIVTVGLDKIA